METSEADGVLTMFAVFGALWLTMTFGVLVAVWATQVADRCTCTCTTEEVIGDE